MPSEFLYPTINKAILLASGIKLNRSFSFSKGGTEYPLKEVPLPKSTNEIERKLDDPSEKWDHKADPVKAVFTLFIQHPDAFYGPYGIAADNTKLGIGVEWKAKDSKVRGYQFLGYVEQRKESVQIGPVEKIIKDITSDLYARIVIFVSEPGTVKKDEFFGNEKGLLLGKLEAFRICVQGKGSVFPLDIVDYPNGPLWNVYVDFDDPYIDLFDDEHVYVAFNKMNPTYKFIDIDSKDYNEEFMKQTFASALATLLLEVRSKYPDSLFDLEKKGDPGSIHTAIRYFGDVKKIDVNGSPAELTKSVIAFIEKEL